MKGRHDCSAILLVHSILKTTRPRSESGKLCRRRQNDSISVSISGFNIRVCPRNTDRYKVALKSTKPHCNCCTNWIISVNRRRTFTIYTDMKNFQYAPDGKGGKFKPFRIDYSIGFQIKPNNNIRFNIEHECDHAVQTKTMTAGEYRYGSNLTTITVTLSGQTRLFGGSK